MNGTLEEQRRIANRLKRARGQLTAVIEAVESGADCRTIVTRLATVSSALDKAGFAIISTAMRECLAEEPTAGDAEAGEVGSGERDRLDVDELERLFLSLA
ncbi:metal-sensitive transcriptional regulator [Agromyces endophyticus]|uniref:metal-sensitive transcriptional regulator n=1 Tax=Agromyces sp. H17E-10 TaxID=2932244 RepID=UPI001FD03F1A|nr:metal-sensitive transcriptional regulator [Agromyces sp. H17E-10]UOQ88451.1 metal-sensitive transcriptional regulator [Agromyces sp. H17E-10]